MITRSSGGRYAPQEMTVKELYDVWHGPSTPTRKKYRGKTGLQIMARKDGRIRPDRVKDVFYQGEQQVYRMTLDNGMEITSTANHRHLTIDGWRRLDKIAVGDLVATMGEAEKVISSESSGQPPSQKNGNMLLTRAVRDIGRCERCGQTEGRLEVAHLDSDRTNHTRENLMLLCNPCHKRHDYATGSRRKRHSRGRPIEYHAVVSIQDAGIQETYDIEMEGEDHSWVGNGIVTHNSHAAAYGIIAYRSAWMRTNRPLDFWAATLAAYEGSTKIKELEREARADKIRLLSAHVNRSTETYTIEREMHAIRRGLRSVKGVKAAAAEIVSKAPYTSLRDFGERVNNRVTGSKHLALGATPEDAGGMSLALYEAGALSGLDEDDD